MLRIGVIGLGGRMAGLARTLADQNSSNAMIVAFTSEYPDYSRAALERQGLTAHDLRHYSDPAVMLVEEKIDGIMIGTRCHEHTDMAILAMKTGLPIFLEKPVAINPEQAQRLAQAAEKSARIGQFIDIDHH